MSNKFSIDEVRAIALDSGFKLKEQPNGEMDLNPYVFDFAQSLVEESEKRIARLEKILQRYETEQLEPWRQRARDAEQRVKELEKEYKQLENKHLNLVLYHNLDPQQASEYSREALNKFAIEQRIEAIDELASENTDEDAIYMICQEKIEQLRAKLGDE